jgi:preprotein translocase subunit SecD
MKSPTKIRLVAVVMILLGLVAVVFSAAEYIPWVKTSPVASWSRPYRLGCDLQGGASLLYQGDFSHFTGESRDDAMAGLRDIIERRVNALGVAEPTVQVEKNGDDHRLIVELCGISDIRQAIHIIGETPSLEFKEIRPEAERNAILEAQKNGERLGEDPYFTPTPLTGRFLTRAQLVFDQTTGKPYLTVTFDDEGARMFEELTEKNIGKPLGIYIDNQLQQAPTVQEKIAGGTAQITGDFTVPQAREYVRNLNSGALPVEIKLINQETVEASLGRDSLEASLKAAFIGFLLVALFMLFWYRLPGLIAILALMIYVAIVLSIFKLIPVTLTAAGIAGFVLSVGMAVDANILIFERMKEELRRGRDLNGAIAEGFARAWTSIRDSNVSSIITAIVLYEIGTSVVRGFALTLIIGVLISMFSAISVSRTFLFAISGPRLEKKKWLFMSGFSK